MKRADSLDAPLEYDLDADDIEQRRPLVPPSGAPKLSSLQTDDGLERRE